MSWNSLFRPGWLLTHRDPPAPTSQLLGFKGIPHHQPPRPATNFFKF
ncbi:mCG140369, isoform CRA_c [Mus musculus]|nr:mCG140369, isoform CRA_c [Mus musculus]